MTDTTRSAAAQLEEAIALEQSLHQAGVRDRYRSLLKELIELARDVHDTDTQKVLLRAHAARAEDARYGAGQLSRGSQRAPTREDCDDGWERVEEIVVGAEEAAREARRLADALGGGFTAEKLARGAEEAARLARQIVDTRNHAYTFHTDPRFSFGEGWHLAAAAILTGITIQLEPDQAHTPHAERFLNDAGLSAHLQPYCSRPRSNKQLTPLVADGFRADPARAQRVLRRAFLGEEPLSTSLVDWAEERLGGAPGAKVLLWIRRVIGHGDARNTTASELLELVRRARAVGLTPVLFGDALEVEVPGALDLSRVWKAPRFQGLDMRRAQLRLFEVMRRHHGLVGQIGVTSAGMDGPALLGLPTLYLTDAPNPRMGRWVGVVPGYEEVVREAGYLERISRVLESWSA